jgi:hypothetical protein
MPVHLLKIHSNRKIATILRDEKLAKKALIPCAFAFKVLLICKTYDKNETGGDTHEKDSFIFGSYNGSWSFCRMRRRGGGSGDH